jgi:hypothetical protein
MHWRYTLMKVSLKDGATVMAHQVIGWYDRLNKVISHDPKRTPIQGH